MAAIHSTDIASHNICISYLGNHVTADQEIPPSSLVGYQIDVKDHIYGVPIEQTKKYEFYGISNTPGLWQ